MVERSYGGPDTGVVRQARDAVAREDWAEAYGLLHRLEPARLTPDDCAAFADDAWWTGRVDESIVHRARAYSGYVAADDARRAAYCAWMLFYKHQLAGHTCRIRCSTPSSTTWCRPACTTTGRAPSATA